MKYKNEEELMKKLDIESWKNLSKDEILELATMMSDIDKESLFKIIDQLPEFTKFGKIVAESLDESIDKLSKSNSNDYSKSLNIIIETQSIIREQLNKSDIDSEEKKFLIENLMQLTEMVRNMDSENKSFLKSLNTDKLKGIAIVTLSIISLVGGKEAISKFIRDKTI